jgi:hypothetical protein
LLLEERKKGKREFGTVGIAVLDAGVDLTNNAPCHNNLKVWSTRQLQNNKKLIYIPEDPNSHGSLVEGSMVGNGCGIIQPVHYQHVSINILKGQSHDEIGQSDFKTFFEALEAACDSSASIVNVSMQLRHETDHGKISRFCNLCCESSDKIFVIAAGNKKQNLDDNLSLDPVRALTNVVIVGALRGQMENEMYPQSNFGRCTVSCMFAGENIKSTMSLAEYHSSLGGVRNLSMLMRHDRSNVCRPTCCNTCNMYKICIVCKQLPWHTKSRTTTAGTSIAAPQVAPLITLQRIIHPDWTAEQLIASGLTTIQRCVAEDWILNLFQIPVAYYPQGRLYCYLMTSNLLIPHLYLDSLDIDFAFMYLHL